jgi:hypothetical protein
MDPWRLAIIHQFTPPAPIGSQFVSNGTSQSLSRRLVPSILSADAEVVIAPRAGPPLF